MGSVMNLLVISKISCGNVAEMRSTCVAGGKYLYTSYICSLNPKR